MNIVTQDHHFDVLKNIEFPKVDVVNIQTFLNDLKKYNNLVSALSKIARLFSPPPTLGRHQQKKPTEI